MSHESASSAGHQSHEIKLEKGSVTGAVVLTLEAGKTGLPVGDSLKTFESTSSMKVNGFVSRLETSLMSGELDVEMFEGLSVAIEANALTVGVEGEETDLDVLSVSLKVVGDATKLIGAPAGMTISLDVRLTMSLAGKLAAKLAKFAAAQLEQKVAVAALEQASKEAAQHAAKVTALKAELSALEKAGRKHYPRAATLRREIRQGEEFLKNPLVQSSLQALVRIGSTQGSLAHPNSRLKQSATHSSALPPMSMTPTGDRSSGNDLGRANRPRFGSIAPK